MPVFKIGAKLLTFQAEQMAVILGRLKMGEAGRGEVRLNFRRWPCPGTRRVGFRLSFMRCLAWDQLEESAADLAARPIARLGAEDLEWECCWQRW